MPLDYVKYIGIALVLFGVGYLGWHLRDNDYQAYKADVLHATKAQEAHVESIKKQQEITTKGIQNEYDAKLSAIRNYYKSTSVWNNSSSPMSGLSTAPKSADVVSAYNVLAGQCAETTQQIVSLQEWINAQMGIK